MKKVNEMILSTLWFYHFLEHAAEADAFGFSLVELVPEGGLIKECVLLPRTNTFPEYNYFNFNYANSTPDISNGVNYADDPVYKKYLVFIGEKKSYGKIMTAAQYVIYKRGGIGDWSQFAELFGMPFRDFEYDPYDEKSRTTLEKAAKELGGAGYMIRPKGTAVTFHDANGTGKSEV